MRTFKVLALALLALVMGALLAGCAEDNADSGFGKNLACKRADFLNTKADEAGISVPVEAKVTAQYHCDHDIKAAEDVLPNRFYPDRIEDGVCNGITAAPETSANPVQDAKCVSNWADHVVYVLNRNKECIEATNLEVSGQTGTNQHSRAVQRCRDSQAKDPDSDAAIGNVFSGIVGIICLIMIFMVGGGGLTAAYMNDRS